MLQSLSNYSRISDLILKVIKCVWNWYVPLHQTPQICVTIIITNKISTFIWDLKRKILQLFTSKNEEKYIQTRGQHLENLKI